MAFGIPSLFHDGKGLKRLKTGYWNIIKVETGRGGGEQRRGVGVGVGTKLAVER